MGQNGGSLLGTASKMPSPLSEMVTCTKHLSPLPREYSLHHSDMSMSVSMKGLRRKHMPHYNESREMSSGVSGEVRYCDGKE